MTASESPPSLFADGLREQFRTVGCVLLPDALEPAVRRALTADLDDAVRDPVCILVEEKEHQQLARIEGFLHRPVWRDLVEQVLQPMASHLLGEPALPFKEKVNFKLPGGGPFRPHQDIPAYDWLPATRHATCMVSLDEASADNGCLEFALEYQQELQARGLWPADPAHRFGSLPHENLDVIPATLVEAMTWTPFPTRTVDLVWFDSHIPHRSGPNPSARSRRAAFLTFSRASEGEHRTRYYDTKRSDPGNPRFHVGTPTRSDRPST